MLTFYQVEWCPQCHTVRQAMTELRLAFTAINVAADPNERAEVVAVSGQAGVPVLQDGDKIFTDSDEIIAYLRATYPAPDDAKQHAARGAWRTARALSLPPQAALARLRGLLEDKGFTIVTQVRGPEIDEAFPKEYVLLQVAVPAAAVEAVQLDPRAPAAILLPIAVLPAEGGGSVIASADPVGQVWLYGELPLNRIQAGVKKSLLGVLAEL
jgi:glutaredoxin